MAFKPPLTICMACMPVKAPREWTYGSLCISSHSLRLPFFARVCSILTEPLQQAKTIREKENEVARGLTVQNVTIIKSVDEAAKIASEVSDMQTVLSTEKP